jgi:hypothetical protein
LHVCRELDADGMKRKMHFVQCFLRCIVLQFTLFCMCKYYSGDVLCTLVYFFPLSCRSFGHLAQCQTGVDSTKKPYGFGKTLVWFFVEPSGCWFSAMTMRENGVTRQAVGIYVRKCSFGLVITLFLIDLSALWMNAAVNNVWFSWFIFFYSVGQWFHEKNAGNVMTFSLFLIKLSQSEQWRRKSYDPRNQWWWSILICHTYW